jgi:hypothetical protein
MKQKNYVLAIIAFAISTLSYAQSPTDNNPAPPNNGNTSGSFWSRAGNN